MRQINSTSLLSLVFLLTATMAQANPKSTAVDRIALPLFAVSEKVKIKETPEEFAKKLQIEVAAALRAKTYLGVRTLGRVVPLKLKKSAVKKTAKRVGVDGVLVGESRRGQVRMALLSGLGGPALQRWILPTPKKLNKKGLIRLTKEITEAVVVAVPYRGFVLDTRRDMVKLSIGKQEAITVGQRLQVFEFTGKRPNFSSDQEYLGEVEVLKVKKETAFARQVKGEAPRYSKISFDSNFAAGLTSENYVASDSWLSVGFDVLSFDTTFPEDKVLDTRAYELAFSPFISLGVGASKWLVDFSYGKAESSFNNVTFTFLTAMYSLFNWGELNNGWLFSVGATARQFKSDLIEESEAALEDAVGIHPFADLKWSWIPRNRTKIYAGGRLLYGITEKGGDATNALSSAGLGLYGGVRIDMTKDFGIETGVKTQYASVALKNNFSFTESQLTIFWRSVILY